EKRTAGCCVSVSCSRAAWQLSQVLTCCERARCRASSSWSSRKFSSSSVEGQLLMADPLAGGLPDGRFLPGSSSALAASPLMPGLLEVAPGVVGQGLEPGAEAARGVVVEVAHLLGQLQQHVLGHVLGVGLLKVPPPAPLVDAGAVMLDKGIPDRLIGRVPAEPA